MTVRLIEFAHDGQPVEALTLPDLARPACEATTVVYKKSEFVRLWVGYPDQGQVVGIGA